MKTKINIRIVLLTVVLLLSVSILGTKETISADGEGGIVLEDYNYATEINGKDVKVVKTNLNLNDIDYSKTTIKKWNECYTTDNEKSYINVDGTKGCTLEPNVPQRVYYKKALKYAEKYVDIEIVLTRTTDKIDDSNMFSSSVKTDDINHVVLLSDNSVRFVGVGEWHRLEPERDNRYNNRSNIKAEINFYHNGSPYNVSGLVGITDPDGGNYLFDNVRRKIYYSITEVNENQDKGDIRINRAYSATNKGLYRNDVSSENWIVPYWDNSILALELDGESHFEINYDSIYDVIYLPTMYSFYYNIEYVMNDEDGPEATNPNADWKTYIVGDSGELKPATRDGYRFLGWTRKDITDSTDPRRKSIVSEDTGDKVFVANWEKIKYQIEFKPNSEYVNGELYNHEVKNNMDNQVVYIDDNTLNENQFESPGYKFVEWNTKQDGTGIAYDDKGNRKVTSEEVKGITEDNQVIDTLYAQWEPIQYTVKYDKNAADAKGNMPDQTPLTYDVDYNLDPNTFTREGYSWVGWNTSSDKSGTPYTNKQGFKNLTTKDKGIVTMYAQWEPWKYYIDYDGNGGVGTMTEQTFVYQDGSMFSKPNAFTREGHRFTGFKYTVNGNVRIINDPNDFKQLLLELGPGARITLVAQWDKIPVSYVAPVTGIE